MCRLKVRQWTVTPSRKRTVGSIPTTPTISPIIQFWESKMTLEEVLKVVEESMVKTCNSYAKENMGNASAIHDAYLCVVAALKQEFENETKT